MVARQERMRRDFPEIEVSTRTWNVEGFERPASLPAETRVDFSRLKIASRLLIGLVLLGGAVFFTILIFTADDERFSSISFLGPGFLALFGIWFTAVSAYHLFVRKPVLTIDAGGLAFLKHEPIAWSEVRSVKVRVTPSDHDLPFLFVKVTPQGKLAPFEVELTQTRIEPDELARILTSYVAAFREARGLPV